MDWFRFYDEVLDDPKVQELPDSLFKAWVNLMCLANRQKRRGYIPLVLSGIAFSLRKSVDVAEGVLTELRARELFEERGDFLVPHGWEWRQYESDNSTKRVQSYRAKHGRPDSPSPVGDVAAGVSRNGDETLHETPKKRGGAKRETLQGAQGETLHETPPESDTEQIQNRADTEREATRTPSTGQSVQSQQDEEWFPDAPSPAPTSWTASPEEFDWAKGEGWLGSFAQLQSVANNWLDNRRKRRMRSYDWPADLREWVRREIRDYQKSDRAIGERVAVATGQRSAPAHSPASGNGSASWEHLAAGGNAYKRPRTPLCSFEGCAQSVPTNVGARYCFKHGTSQSHFHELKPEYLLAGASATKKPPSVESGDEDELLA